MRSARSWRTLASVLVIGAIPFVAATPVAHAATEVIDFETQTDDLTGQAYPPLTIGNATFSGGRIYTSLSNFPANQTTVYGTIAGLCTGCLDTLLIQFNSPVQNLAFDVYNGDSYTIQYSAVSAGGIVVKTLASNMDSGQARFVIPDVGISTVSISRFDENLTGFWDFLIDNISYDTGPTQVQKPLYATYRWQSLTSKESAIAVMKLSPTKFVAEATSPYHDVRLNWSNDGCSGPADLDLLWADNFLNACIRHDFGYRNFGIQGGLDTTGDRKSFVDNIFRDDMGAVCKKVSVFVRPSCKLSATNFYNAVHFSLWGNNAFFGDSN